MYEGFAFNRAFRSFECQVVDHIAREAHEIPVNYIITEAATYAVG